MCWHSSAVRYDPYGDASTMTNSFLRFDFSMIVWSLLMLRSALARNSCSLVSAVAVAVAAAAVAVAEVGIILACSYDGPSHPDEVPKSRDCYDKTRRYYTRSSCPFPHRSYCSSRRSATSGFVGHWQCDSARSHHRHAVVIASQQRGLIAASNAGDARTVTNIWARYLIPVSFHRYAQCRSKRDSNTLQRASPVSLG